MVLSRPAAIGACGASSTAASGPGRPGPRRRPRGCRAGPGRADAGRASDASPACRPASPPSGGPSRRTGRSDATVGRAAPGVDWSHPGAPGASARWSARLAVLPSSDQKTGEPAPGAGRWRVARAMARPEAAHEAPGLVGGGEEDREGGRRTQVVDAAGVDAADQRVDQPLHHRPSQALPDDVTHRPVAEGRPGRQMGVDQVRRPPAPTRPGSRIPERSSGHHRVGTPRFSPRASSAAGPGPRWRRRRRPPGPVRRSGRVRRRARSASGRRARKASAARSTAPSGELGRPGACRPVRPADSSTDDLGRRAVAVSPGGPPTSSHAAARPAMPAADHRDDRPGARGRCRCRPGRTGHPAAPAAARTTPARMARNRGSSLRDGVRAKATPTDRATLRRPRCRGRRGSRGGRRRTRPGTPPPRWRPRRPPAGSRGAGRARSTGRRSAPRSAMPPPRSGRDRRRAPRRRGDVGRRLGHLVGIGVALGHHPGGEAVGGEEHRRVRGARRRVRPARQAARVRSASSGANPSARCHEGTAVELQGRDRRGRGLRPGGSTRRSRATTGGG